MTSFNHRSITDTNSAPQERVMWRLTKNGVGSISIIPSRSQRTTVRLYEGELRAMYEDLDDYFSEDKNE